MLFNCTFEVTESLWFQCPDVELVEPQAVTVKEEKVDPNGSKEEKTEPDVQLIGDDGKYAVRRIAPASFCVDRSVTLLLHLPDVWMEMWWGSADVFLYVVYLKLSIVFCLYEGEIKESP